jgi:hypothetical protein
VGEILRGVSSRSGLAAGLEAAEVLGAWEALAGRLGAICRGEGFRAGEILLAGRTPAAAQEVSLRREAIRGEINRHLGREAVRAVRVAHRAEGWGDEGSAPGALSPATAADPVLAAEEIERIERQIAAIPAGDAREGARRVLLRMVRVRAVRAAMGWGPCSACGALTDPGQGALCPFCRPTDGG